VCMDHFYTVKKIENLENLERVLRLKCKNFSKIQFYTWVFEKNSHDRYKCQELTGILFFCFRVHLTRKSCTPLERDAFAGLKADRSSRRMKGFFRIFFSNCSLYIQLKVP